MVKKKKKPRKTQKRIADPPSFRQTLFAPWRLKYVRSPDKTERGKCVFCVSAESPSSFESLVVKKTKHAMIIMNKFPYNSGHMMVVPLRHTSDFVGLTDEEREEISFLTKIAVEALNRLYQPQGMNMGMNLGRSAGAGIVDHLHHHIVPRWEGDCNFMPVIGNTRVVVESLEQTYDKLVKYFLDYES